MKLLIIISSTCNIFLKNTFENCIILTGNFCILLIFRLESAILVILRSVEDFGVEQKDISRAMSTQTKFSPDRIPPT